MATSPTRAVSSVLIAATASAAAAGLAELAPMRPKARANLREDATAVSRITAKVQ